MIVRLTKAQRAALEEARDHVIFRPYGSKPHQLANRLIGSGLLRWGERGGYFLTDGGRLALKAKPADRAWWHQLPELENSHTIRKCHKCVGCGQLGLRLPQSEHGRIHGSCLVEKFGWQALAELPAKEWDEMCANDFIFLGLTLEDTEPFRRPGGPR